MQTACLFWRVCKHPGPDVPHVPAVQCRRTNWRKVMRTADPHHGSEHFVPGAAQEVGKSFRNHSQQILTLPVVGGP